MQPIKQKHKRRTPMEWRKDIESHNKVKVLGECKRAKDKVLVKCLFCNNEFEAIIERLANGSMCFKCSYIGRMNRKNPELFEKELYDINPNIRILEKYTLAKSKILCECIICSNIWDVEPSNLLSGQGCPKCNKKSKFKKTHDQYLSDLKKVHLNITPLENYNGANVNIRHKCNKCNYEWLVAPTSLLYGYGCPKCAMNERSIDENSFLDLLFKSHPEIVLVSNFTRSSHFMDFRCTKCGTIFNRIGSQVLKNIQPCPNCYVNPNLMKKEYYCQEMNKRYDSKIKIIGDFIDSTTPILVKCVECNHEWTVIPRNSIQSCGCPECFRRSKLISYDETLNQIQSKFNNISFISDYNGYMENAIFYCFICDFKFETTPQKLYSTQYGCPSCARKHYASIVRSTNDMFVEKIKLINPMVIPLEEYVTSQTHIKFQCTKCNYIWSTIPNSVLQGTGCPRCKRSILERKVELYLINSENEYEDRKVYDGLVGIGNKSLSYDFYLPVYNLLIECQGEQHEHPVDYFGGEKQFATQQEHDRRKREYAKRHNINLLEIWYYENVEEKLDKYFNNLNTNLNLESVETVIPT